MERSKEQITRVNALLKDIQIELGKVTEIQTTEILSIRKSVRYEVLQLQKVITDFTEYHNATTEEEDGYIERLENSYMGYKDYVQEHDNVLNAYSSTHQEELLGHIQTVQRELSDYVHFVETGSTFQLDIIRGEIRQELAHYESKGIYVHINMEDALQGALNHSGGHIVEYISDIITQEYDNGNYDMVFTGTDTRVYVEQLRGIVERRLSRSDDMLRSTAVDNIYLRSNIMDLLKVKEDVYQSEGIGADIDFTGYIESIGGLYLVDGELTELRGLEHLQEKLNMDINYLTDGSKVGMLGKNLLKELNKYPKELLGMLNTTLGEESEGTPLYYTVLQGIIYSMGIDVRVTSADIQRVLKRYPQMSYKQSVHDILMLSNDVQELSRYKIGLSTRINYEKEIKCYIDTHYVRLQEEVTEYHEERYRENLARYVENVRGSTDYRFGEKKTYERLLQGLSELSEHNDYVYEGYDDYCLITITAIIQGYDGDTHEVHLEMTPHYIIDVTTGIYLYVTRSQLHDELDYSQQGIDEEIVGVYQELSDILRLLMKEEISKIKD